MNIDHRVVRAYLNAMRQFAIFHGRTAADDFLMAQWVFLPIVLISFGLLGVPLIAGGEWLGSPSAWPVLFDVIFVLPHVVPWAALMVRRLHDLDRTGAWALLALLPIGFLLPFPLTGLIILGAQPGTQAPNRFGPATLGHTGKSTQSPTQAGLNAHAPQLSAKVEATSHEVIAQIERLAQLRANGALSDTEYEVMKAQALGRSGLT